MMPFLYLLVAVGLVGLVIIVIVELRAQGVREATARQAHEKVIELREKGLEADICFTCGGKGRHGLVTRSCDRCGGVGYTYERPVVKRG